eukprot:7962062-Alexandrium_andersonii.AAC.1
MCIRDRLQSPGFPTSQARGFDSKSQGGLFGATLNFGVQGFQFQKRGPSVLAAGLKVLVAPRAFM